MNATGVALGFSVVIGTISERNEVNANGRRAKQAKNGFAHLTPRQRPNYKQRDAASSQRHQARLIATERRIQQGRKKGK